MKDLLTSWKEIATYLGRTPRTVQRWEKEFKLPVHRPPHKQSRLVIADTDELDNWAIENRAIHDSAADSHIPIERQATNNEILQEIARKESSSTVFADLTDFIEQTLSCDFAEISLIDYRLKRLFHAAGPNVPKALLDSTAFYCFSPGYGCSSAAAVTQKPALSICIKSDPKWVNVKHLAAKNDLTSCWSQPILLNGCCVGIVAAFFRKRRRPTCDHLTFLELVSHVAAISLQMSGVTEPLDEFERNAGFIGVDSELRVRAINREASRILDRSAKDAVGQKLLDLNPSMNPVVQREFSVALERRITVAFEAVSNTLGAKFTIIARPSNDGLAIFFKESTAKASAAVA